MPISLVPGQEDRGTGFGSSHTPSLPGNFTAGNLLVLLITRADTPGSEPTVSDTVNGAYTITSFDLGGTEKVYICYVRNCLGGINSCTVSWSGGVTSSHREFFEFTGQSNSQPVLTGHNGAASGTSHAMAVTGDHVSGIGLFIAAAQIENVVTTTYTSGWTHQNSAAASDVIEYKIQTATDETAAFTVDVSSGSVSVMAFFPDTSADIPGYILVKN